MGRKSIENIKTGTLPIYVRKTFFVNKMDKKTHQEYVEDFTWLLCYNEQFKRLFEQFREEVDKSIEVI